MTGPIEQPAYPIPRPIAGSDSLFTLIYQPATPGIEENL
jgi:hypothetical protein